MSIPSGTSGANSTNSSPPSQIPSHITPLIDNNQTDAGNAECLVFLFATLLRFCRALSKGKRWLIWNGQCWKQDETGQVTRFALTTVRARYEAAIYQQGLQARIKLANWALTSENQWRLNAMLESASTMLPFATSIGQYDTNSWIAATQNSTLDLRATTVREPDREDYLTMQLGCAFDDTADCPRWRQFLLEIFGGDQELIQYIQRAVGYTLTGDTREQVMFLCWGDGANGKSIFLTTICALLGDYAGNASFNTFDAEGRRGVGEDLAFLRGKRLVTMIETNEDRQLDEAKVKSITGNDRITCRFLYGNPFTYKPTYKIWFAMNHRPIIRGTDRGIWRRVHLIPFLINFENRQDKELEAKLKAELPGILNWALDGLHDWLHNGLGTAAAIQLATEEYRQESDWIGLWLQESITTTLGVSTTVHEIYNCWREWCKRNGIRSWLTSHKLARELKKRGYRQDPHPHKVQSMNGQLVSRRVWLDMTLTDEARDWLNIP